MSEINPPQSTQPNPIAGGCLSADTWQIWVRPKLDVNKYQPRFLNISSPEQLTASLNYFKHDNLENLAELIFCRKAVNSEHLHPNNGIGKWVNWPLAHPVVAMSIWKTVCTTALNKRDVKVYGVKLETFHNGQYKMVRWMAK